MYVDKIADDDIRNSAQTVFGIIILGLGPMLAAPLLGFLSSLFGEAAWLLILQACGFLCSYRLHNQYSVFFVAFTEEAESSI